MKYDKIKVLLIDDEPQDFRTIFNSGTWDVEVETDSTKVERRLSDPLRFDVILLDLDLENSNSFDKGLDYLKKLNHFINFSIPIIIITRDSREDSILKALNNGAAEFIQKGQYDPAWIREEIINVVDSHKRPTSRGSDSFLTNSRLIKQQRSFLTSHLNDPGAKQIISIMGAPGAGKHFMVKFLKKQDLDIQNLDLKNIVHADVLKIESKSIIAINNIESTSLGVQTYLVDLIKNLKNSYIFLLSDKFNLQYYEQKITDELFDLVTEGIKIELLPLNDRAEEIPDLIQGFLLDSKICPKHLSYFAKSAQEVFSKECIDLLKSFNWQSNIHELRNFIQYSFSRVMLRRPYSTKRYPSLITQDFFPARLSLKTTNSSIPIEGLTPDKEDFRFLETLNKELNQCGNNIEYVVNKMNKTEEFIQKKLKEFYYNENINSWIANFPNAFSVYKINVFFCYALESKSIYENLFNYIKPFLEKNKIGVSNNYKLQTSNDVERSLATRLSEADIICLILCTDLLSSDVWECKTPREYAESKKNPKQVVVPIIGKKLIKSSKFLELQALPTDRSPLSNNNRLKEKKIVEVAEGIIESIKKLMSQLNKIPSHP